MFWERKLRRTPEEIEQNYIRRFCAEEIASQLVATDDRQIISRIVLYGSVASDKDRKDSDVDLGIILKGNFSEAEENRLSDVFYKMVGKYAAENIPTSHLPLHLTVISGNMYKFYLNIGSPVVKKIENGIVLWRNEDE